MYHAGVPSLQAQCACVPPAGKRAPSARAQSTAQTLQSNLSSSGCLYLPEVVHAYQQIQPDECNNGCAILQHLHRAGTITLMTQQLDSTALQCTGTSCRLQAVSCFAWILHYHNKISSSSCSVDIPTAEARSCLRFQAVPSGTGQAIVVSAVAEGSSAEEVRTPAAYMMFR
jgi:hypothetical protein